MTADPGRPARAAPAIPELGQPLTVSQADLLADIADLLRDGRGFAIATPNLDHVVKLRRDAAFRAAYGAQTHIVADGNPIVWLQRLAGRPVDLVPGSDLIAPLMALAARMGMPVALLGARDAVLDLAGARLEAAHPGLQVVCRIAPPQGFDATGPLAEEYLARIEASGARICLIALGAPKQEQLAARGLARQATGGATVLGGACGYVSIGAGLDFIAGSERRAPGWMRALALEWAWRLMRNWRRMTRRYLECAMALPGLAWTAWRGRTRAGGS